MKKISAAFVMAVFATGMAYGAGDAAAGKAKAAMCAGCHGAAGVSINPMWPNLAGQKEAYLSKQIIAFRDGTRTDAVMGPMAASLSDEDAANLAAYFAGL